MEESFQAKKQEFVIKLAEDLMQFLAEKPLVSFSRFTEVKIFISAYMHIMNSFGIYIRPDPLLDNEPEEIIDLWGLASCKISHVKGLFKKDTTVLKGMSKKQKQNIKNQLNEKKSIVDIL